MRSEIVFTLAGPDRVGIVEDVTRAFLSVDGNVETSRMVRLGGEFAILMQVTLPAERVARLDDAFDALVDEGFRISHHEASASAERDGWVNYEVIVDGADHEGIVYEIVAGMSRQGISIESMETSTHAAPVSGATLFSMRALVAVPPTVGDEWVTAVQDAGAHANVDVDVEDV